MHNPLDSRLLANFYEIAKSKSIRKAAIHLNLTTSAVSHSLKRLEEDLGCKLFTRDTRKIVLTEKGECLLAQAENLLGSLTAARSLVLDYQQASHKTLRIGATTGACQYIIPLVLRELKESFPEMNIQIIPGNTYELIELLEDDKIDTAIYPAGYSDKRKNKTLLGTDNLAFVVNPKHTWAVANKSNISDIGNQRLILTGTKDYTFDLINEYFRSHSKPLVPFIEISNEEVIKRLIELDIGIGILPNWMLKRETIHETMRTLPLGRRQLKRHWVVAHNEHKEPGFNETLFIGITKNVAQSLFSGVMKQSI